MFFNEQQINQIIQVSKNAGKLIVEKYCNNITFKLKKDNTPLTKVDLLAHKMIENGLKKITPNINLISEEGNYISLKDRKLWQEYWLIDPLDGTRGFINKTDDFCVCIAYIKNNKPVFGLIYAPILDVYYIANSKNNAYKITNNNWQSIFTTKLHTPAKIIVGKFSINTKHLYQHLDGLFGKNSYQVYSSGSALKFCFIAEGLYDYYPALGICSEWDTAAGSFILKAAGGNVLDLHCNQLKYNTKNDMLSPHFFAFGNFPIDI